MAIDRFTPRDMTRSIRIMGDGRQNFLTNAVFENRGADSLHPTNVIDFGKMQIKARVATYQKTGGPAVAINKSSSSAKTVIAPKIREKVVLDEDFADVLNASLDSYMGPYTDPNTQMAEKIAAEQSKLRMRQDKAMELQAAQALSLGVITLTYEDGSTNTVDLEFTTATTLTDFDSTILKKRSGTELWTSESSKPLDLLENMAGSIRDNSDYNGPLDVIMGLNAWLNFYNNPQVQKLLDNRNINLGDLPMIATTLFKGRINGFGIYQYSNGYVDSSDARIQAFDTNKIVMMPAVGSGTGKLTQEFGAVFEQLNPNQSAGYIRTDYFSKMNHSSDPPVDEIIAETRPLMLVKDPEVIRVCEVA